MKKTRKVITALLPSLFVFGMVIPLSVTFVPSVDEAGEDTAIYSEEESSVKDYNRPDFVLNAADDDDDEDSDEPFVAPSKVELHYYNDGGIGGGDKGSQRAFYIWASGVDGVEISRGENAEFYEVSTDNKMMTLHVDYSKPLFAPYAGKSSLMFIIKYEKKSASDLNWGGQSEDMQLSFRTYPPVNGVTEVWTMPSSGGGIAILDSYNKTQVHGVKQAEFTDWKTIHCEVTDNTNKVNWKLYAYDETYYKVKAKKRAEIEKWYLVKEGTGTGSAFDISLKYEAHINVVYNLVSHDPSSDSDPDMAALDKSTTVSFENLYYTDKFHKYYENPFVDTEYDYLGMHYTPEATTFRVWSPISANMTVLVYDDGTPTEYSDASHPGNDKAKGYHMSYKSGGIWEVKIEGDLNGKYYCLQVDNTLGTNVTMDPYATSSGISGIRGFIYDKNSSAVTPTGWKDFNVGTLETPQDLSIYEVHVQDFTGDESWGGPEEERGKYNGFVRSGTTLPSDSTIKTGYDHLNELGVNAVQITPTFDHDNDERPGKMKYNWGYNPLNYNIPEGGYSSDPFDGATRVKEFRNLVLQMSKTTEKTRVIMDVVYNHVSSASASNFNKLMPRYYFRYARKDHVYHWTDEHGNPQTSTVSKGTMWDGSGCNNEVATERPMMRKFIVDSLCMWAKDYKIKGFRFDLMGLIDFQTLRKAQVELYEIDPSIYMYGECWTGSGYDNGQGYHGEGSDEWKAENPGVDPTTFGAFRWQVFNECALSTFPEEKAIYLGAFNDKTRDAIRGTNNEGGYPGSGMLQKGNITAEYGDHNLAEDVVRGLWGNNHSDQTWGWIPEQSVTYVSCHDNWTVRDQLYNTLEDGSPASTENLIRASIQAHALTFVSNTPAFIQGGEELFRTKELDFDPNEHPEYNVKPSDCAKLHGHWICHNSYNTPASVNAFKWGNKKTLTVDGHSVDVSNSGWKVFDVFKQLVKVHKDLTKKPGGENTYDSLMKKTSSGSDVINVVWNIHESICSMQVNETIIYMNCGHSIDGHGIDPKCGGTWSRLFHYGDDGTIHEDSGNYWITFTDRFGIDIFDAHGNIQEVKKMKKKLLLTILVLPLLAACSGSEMYTPRFAYPGEDPKEFDMTVNFYLDYSHSTELQWVEVENSDGTKSMVLKDVEAPFFSMKWYMLEPLGECPAEAVLDDSKAADPLFSKFLGYSEYPTAIDEDLIWDFSKDYKQSNVLNLYGIWVAQ